MSDSDSDVSTDSDASIAPPISSLAISSLATTPAAPLSPAALLFQTLYDGRYCENHGKKLSRAERKREGYISATLTYGEIRFDTFQELVGILEERKMLPEEGGVFVDVGCGIGKPVFAAAMLHGFRRCIGIEILEDCYNACVDTLGFFGREVRPVLGEAVGDEKRVLPENLQISFLHNDALEVDWSTADLVFMNSTCFNMPLMMNLSVQCRALKVGAVIVTTTKKILGKQ